MIHLFEYQNSASIPFDWTELESFLDDIWKKREVSSYFNDGERVEEGQRFLNYLHKSKEIKSNKYIGVIHFKGEKINLLPKIFHQNHLEYNDNQIAGIQQHLLWWLSYGKKIKFPSFSSPTSKANSDFFEVLIYLFSKYTRELLHSSIYQNYVESERELSFVKGRIDTNAYVNNQLSRGNAHRLPCVFDSFEMDNPFNRIIKYVAKLLFQSTQNPDNKKHLREILFLLDEVSDVPARAEDCSRIQFNPMFGAFETVRDYCTLFLSHCVSFDYKNDLKLFAFLIPMEALFEDFIFGFIEKELPELTTKGQRANTYLDEERNFKIRPDLFIETPVKTFIADTKYKIIYHSGDGKQGISQSDLYQMISYAIRFKVKDIVLFYPSTVHEGSEVSKSFHIHDELADGTSISIQAFQVPIIHHAMIQDGWDSTQKLQDVFEPTTMALRERLREILK